MRQRNSFDSLRLLGSIIVLVGHAFIITGTPQLMVGDIPLHSFGVCIFFSISGFLITQSWLSDGDLGRFLQRRLLRIIPALVVTVFATALVVGPISTTEPLATYYSHGATYRYILSNSILVTDWGLPNVFSSLPIHGQANGSLWTLPIEFSLYLIVPVIVLLYSRLSRATPWALLAISVMVVIAEPFFPHLYNKSIRGVNVGWGLGLAPYFWVGSALRLLELSSWSLKQRRIALTVSVSMLALWVIFQGLLPTTRALLVIPIALLVLLIGLEDWLHSALIERVGDLSYGVYLWAFPIQQLIRLKLGGGPLLNLAIAAPTTMIIAYGSWHLVERSALRFKPRRRSHPEQEEKPAVSELAIQTPS